MEPLTPSVSDHIYSKHDYIALKIAKCVTMSDKPTVQAKNELKYPKYAAVGRYA